MGYSIPLVDQAKARLILGAPSCWDLRVFDPFMLNFDGRWIHSTSPWRV